MIVEQTAGRTDAPVGGRRNMAVTVTQPEICSAQTHQTVNYDGQSFLVETERGLNNTGRRLEFK